MDESQFTDNALRIITNATNLAKDNSPSQLLPLHFLAAMVPTDEENSVPYLKTLIQILGAFVS